MGKAIMAYSNTADAINLRNRKTRYSISSRSQLDVELAKVRAHGVAFDREESLPGFGCVAAPIGDPGEAVAAVSVCGPMSRMLFDQRMAAPVRMTAMHIWRNVDGGRGMSRRRCNRYARCVWHRPFGRARTRATAGRMTPDPDMDTDRPQVLCGERNAMDDRDWSFTSTLMLTLWHASMPSATTRPFPIPICAPSRGHRSMRSRWC
ncbi:bacterial transcriptional regulator family protein [Mycobacterium xenopi 3993]|nr:bacterial transcriptional regulator family protein [Mycobacterium xenopi 3993]